MTKIVVSGEALSRLASELVMEKESKKGYKYGNEADIFMNNGRNKNYIYFDRIKTRLGKSFQKMIYQKFILKQIILTITKWH